MAASEKFAAPSGEPAKVYRIEKKPSASLQAPPEEPPHSKMFGSYYSCCAQQLGEGTLEAQHCGITLRRSAKGEENAGQTALQRPQATPCPRLAS